MLGSDFDGADPLIDGVGGMEDVGKLIDSLPYSKEIREKIAYKNFVRLIDSYASQ